MLGFSTSAVQSIPGVRREASFAAGTSAFVLGIRGYEFGEYEERISERARANLAAATNRLLPRLDASAGVAGAERDQLDAVEPPAPVLEDLVALVLPAEGPSVRASHADLVLAAGVGDVGHPAAIGGDRRVGRVSPLEGLERLVGLAFDIVDHQPGRGLPLRIDE